MIDFEKVLTFCDEIEVSYEEFMLLYSLHVRHQNSAPHLHPLIKKYYSLNSDRIDWNTTVYKLRDLGLLTILKDSTTGIWEVRHLEITEKFVSLLFANPDDTWKKFIARYPAEGLSPGNASTFKANIIKDGDKDYFNQFIYKNATPEEGEEILSLIEGMFGWDEEEEKPKEFAHVSISRFLRNWDSYVAHYNLEVDSKQGWGTRL